MGRAQAARTPFVLLVVLLLGGGLIGLLVLNSALSEGAFELDDLKRETKSLTDEEQALQRDIDAHSAPDALQRRARELGMVPGGDPVFLSPDGKVKGARPGLRRPRPPGDPSRGTGHRDGPAPYAVPGIAAVLPTSAVTPTPASTPGR
ncbi:FtsB family cell division protein [Streptomyces sp. INA 01156]